MGVGKNRNLYSSSRILLITSHTHIFANTEALEIHLVSLYLPKVNFFTWLLMHKNALTGENINKRGFHGPFRYCLCTSAIETSDHLLVDCVFTQKVWKMVLHGLSIPTASQISVVTLYTS